MVKNIRGGASEAANLMLGNSEVARVYKGTALVWERAVAGEVFTGVIAMFESIPTGWVTCDGTNGTPDLRDRFIVCAGGTYTAGDIGGASSVTLVTANLPLHNHTITSGGGGLHGHTSASVSSSNTHSHTVSTTGTSHAHTYVGYGNMANFLNQFANYAGTTGTTPSTATTNATEPAHSLVTSSAAGNHSHSSNNSGTHGHTGSTNASGSGGSHENRPPYYALIFAMATAEATVADGTIAMASAAVTGWAILNGTTATPDLRDRFIVAVGPSYALGAVGGANTVTLTNTTSPQHSHNLSITSDNAGHAHNSSTTSSTHQHNVNLSAHATHIHTYDAQNANTLTIGGTSGTAVRAGPTASNTGSTGSAAHSVSWASATDAHSHSSTNTDGGHSHTATGSNEGSGTAHENRPPYHALNYIKKVGAATAFDSGVIVGFHGATLPAGWVLCDGVAAPDLRGRFIVGAGSTYAVGATGGADTVALATANMPSHTHNGTVSTAAGHAHSLTSTSTAHTHSGSAAHGNHTHTANLTSNSGTSRSSGTQIAGMTSVVTRNTSTNTNHTHNATAQANNATHTHTLVDQTDHTHSMSMGNEGSGTAHENRPPYYALKYIQKL